MEPGVIIAAVAGVGGMVMLSPLFAFRMWLRHKEKVTAMKYRQEGAPGILEEVAALRREVAALRETTTKFDMSFDAAISRLEGRVDRLEEPAPRGVAPSVPDEAEAIVRRGR